MNYITHNIINIYTLIIYMHIILSQEFLGKTEQQPPPHFWALYTQIASLLYLMIYILYISFFVQFHPLKTEISLNQKFRKKVSLQRLLLTIFTKSWYRHQFMFGYYQDIPKWVNPSKTGNQKFAPNQDFVLLI